MCDCCPRIFTSEEKLRYHKDKESSKNDEGNFKCCKCPKTFNFKKHLAQHDKTHNKDINKQICQECGTQLSSLSALTRHIKQQHGHEYPCSECEKIFQSKSNLNQHLKTHRLEKPHQCGHCQQHFSLKDHLEIHLKAHDKANCCSKCTEKFVIELTMEKLRSRLNVLNNHVC